MPALAIRLAICFGNPFVIIIANFSSIRITLHIGADSALISVQRVCKWIDPIMGVSEAFAGGRAERLLRVAELTQAVRCCIPGIGGDSSSKGCR
jgi:hypothetical protein